MLTNIVKGVSYMEITQQIVRLRHNMLMSPDSDPALDDRDTTHHRLWGPPWCGEAKGGVVTRAVGTGPQPPELPPSCCWIHNTSQCCCCPHYKSDFGSDKIPYTAHNVMELNHLKSYSQHQLMCIKKVKKYCKLLMNFQT